MDPLGGPRTCGIWPPALRHVRRRGPPAGRPGVTWGDGGHVGSPPPVATLGGPAATSLKGVGTPPSASGGLPRLRRRRRAGILLQYHPAASRKPRGGRCGGAQMDPLMADPLDAPSEPCSPVSCRAASACPCTAWGGCLGPWAVHAQAPCPVLACPCSSHTPQRVGALSATSQDSSFRRWLDTSRSGHTTLVLAHSRLEDMIIHVSSLSMTQVMIMHCSTRHAQCHCRMRLSNVHCVVVKDSSAAPTMQAN